MRIWLRTKTVILLTLMETLWCRVLSPYLNLAYRREHRLLLTISLICRTGHGASTVSPHGEGIILISDPLTLRRGLNRFLSLIIVLSETIRMKSCPRSLWQDFIPPRLYWQQCALTRESMSKLFLEWLRSSRTPDTDLSCIAVTKSRRFEQCSRRPLKQLVEKVYHTIRISSKWCPRLQPLVKANQMENQKVLRIGSRCVQKLIVECGPPRTRYHVGVRVKNSILPSF